MVSDYSATVKIAKNKPKVHSIISDNFVYGTALSTHTGSVLIIPETKKITSD